MRSGRCRQRQEERSVETERQEPSLNGRGKTYAALSELPKQCNADANRSRDEGHSPASIARDVLHLFLGAIPKVHGFEQGPGQVPA